MGRTSSHLGGRLLARFAPAAGTRYTPPMRTAALVLALAAFSSLAACGGEGPKATPEAPSAKPTDAPRAEKAGPEVKASTFSAKLEGASAKVGETATAVLTVLPASGYKVNEEYPYKFKLDAPPEGVTYPAAVVTDVERTKERATMKLPFVAQKAGTYQVSGTCSLSVCSDATCVIEKVPLSVEVSVN